MKRRGAFTLMELLVVIGIIGVLLAILLPMAERVRHKAYIDKCASNLRNIGQALQIYSNDNHGNYPRTMYRAGDPWTVGTGAASVDAFHASDRPANNDVTAAVFLLMRVEKIPSAIFICPYGDEFAYEPDHADIQSRSNFTDVAKNLAYSFADPYPSQTAVDAGYKWTNRLGAEFAVASDKNPGYKPPKFDVINVTIHSGSSDMEEANSLNHEYEGQNVLYGDGHVAWKLNPFAGPNQENIFDNAAGTLSMQVSPVNKDDCMLIPASN